jgi:hypothetical protein
MRAVHGQLVPVPLLQRRVRALPRAMALAPIAIKLGLDEQKIARCAECGIRGAHTTKLARDGRWLEGVPRHGRADRTNWQPLGATTKSWRSLTYEPGISR